MKRLLILLAMGVILKTQAQEMPIGHWRAHMPYNEAVAAATDGVTIYAGSRYSFFTYNAASDEISTYSKVEGMSDVGIAAIGHDITSGYTIIAYTNSNIDLFKNETFYNIPDIKIKSLAGDKTINHIYTENGFAYLSTGFGVVVLNLSKRETRETYTFTQNNIAVAVKSFTAVGNFFYVATTAGLFRANRNSINLQDFSSWERLDERALEHVASSNLTLAAATTDSLFLLDNDTLKPVYQTHRTIKSLDSAAGKLWVAEFYLPFYNGKTYAFDEDLNLVDSVFVKGDASRTLALADGSIWMADAVYCLGKRSGDEFQYFHPQGPAEATSFDIMPHDGDVWIAHGSYNDTWSYTMNSGGVSHYNKGSWNIYNRNKYQELMDATDFITLAKDPRNGTVYAGAYRSGLMIIKPDGSFELLKENTNFLEPTVGDPGAYRVAGLAFDQQGALWLSQAGAVHEIVVRSPEGQWQKLRGAASAGYAVDMVIDDYNQKWYLAPSGPGGVAVYNDNGTPELPGDDRYVRVSTNAVSSGVTSIALDKTGSIWIGTVDGIGIFHCPGQVLDGTCAIDRPIVQYDQFAGYLFQNERVNTIAVDGANRKWIGTNNGVWLISPDGDRIIHRFTAENSPLPSNILQKIEVDPVTGDVYFGTALGLVSFRGTATEGGPTNENVISFPNPVPPGYTGTIAIRGLAENSDVRITDVSGQLVYRTRANGGQAVWDGRDYTGRRPQSGIYLIFVTNRDGSQTHSGKLVFME